MTIQKALANSPTQTIRICIATCISQHLPTLQPLSSALRLPPIVHSMVPRRLAVNMSELSWGGNKHVKTELDSPHLPVAKSAPEVGSGQVHKRSL